MRPGIKAARGAALEYRTIALEDLNVDEGAVRIIFAQEEFVDRKGSYGCADIGIADTVAPGGSIVQRERWDGYSGTLLGPPPSGLVRLTGQFMYYWRQPDGQPDVITNQKLDLHLDAWIQDAGPAPIHPAEAIDIALTDRRLIDVIEARDLRNANETLIRFDPGEGVWKVGLLDYSEPPVVHLVLVDGLTGEITGWEERIWNYETDGFP